MNRNPILAIALAAGLASGLAFAQPDKGPQRDPEARMARLTTVLELTPAQQSALRAIFERKHAERAAGREARQQEFKARRDAFKADRQKRRAQMRQELSGVLNAEQMAKLDALAAGRGEHRRPGARRDGGRNPGRE